VGRLVGLCSRGRKGFVPLFETTVEQLKWQGFGALYVSRVRRPRRGAGADGSLYFYDLCVYPENKLGNIIGGPMSVPPPNSNRQPSADLRPFDRLTLATIGVGVIFASLGLGEAVYRLAFFDFDGATDRLPIEMVFGLAFAWMTMKLAKRIYQHRMEALARINVVWDRNHKIRHALQAIEAVPLPSHQQAIRVIRDEVDRIEWALTDVLPR